MRKFSYPLVELAAFLLGFFIILPASAATLTINAGTYALSDTIGGPQVDTMNISVSGGLANFTVTGQDNVTFSVLDVNGQSGTIIAGVPYFTGSAIKSASFDTTLYPNIGLWGGVGGLVIGPTLESNYGNLVMTIGTPGGNNNYYTVTGTGSVSPVPLKSNALIVLFFIITIFGLIPRYSRHKTMRMIG